MFGKTLWSEKNHPGKVHQFAQVYLPLGCFLKKIQDAEKCTFFTSAEILLYGTLFLNVVI